MAMSDQIPPGGALQPGESLLSKSQEFRLVMEVNGNLSLWQVGHLPPIWQTGTIGRNPASLNMRTDGLLQLINFSQPQRLVLWTVPGKDWKANSTFQVLDSGLMVIWGPHGPTWQSRYDDYPDPNGTETPWCCTLTDLKGNIKSIGTISATDYGDALRKCSDRRNPKDQDQVFWKPTVKQGACGPTSSFAGPPAFAPAPARNDDDGSCDPAN